LSRGLAGLFLALALAGCGFEPLHGGQGPGGGTTSQRLAQVQVAPIGDRVGQLVRNRLLDYFEPPGSRVSPVYRLVVDLDELKDGLAIESDRTVTRYNMTLMARYQLVEIASGRIVLDGQTRAISAYNVIRSDYANLIAERDALSRAAQEIADVIGLRVAVRLQPQTAAR
jgi:LPS-assembly lipoprotein